jgi:MFS family permease
MLFQMGAMQMQTFIRGFLVYELTESPTLLGVVASAMSIPIVTFGLFGGVLADRLDKRRLIQVAQVLSLVIALALAVSISIGAITWVHLLLASVAQGFAIAIMMPTRQAVIPQLVPKEQLTNAIALNAMGMSIVMMITPAMGGVLVGVIGVEGVYYLMTGMYGCAIVLTVFLPKLDKPVDSDGRGMFRDLIDGLRYVRGDRRIRLLLMLAFATVLFSEPLRSILPVFAKDVFGVGSRGLGIMLSMMGGGSLIGAFAIASGGKVEGQGLRLLLTSLFSGSMFIGFGLVSSFAPAFWLGGVFLVIIGATMPIRMTLNNSLVLGYADPRYRGRVMGLFFMSFGLVPAAMLPLGLLTDAIGAPMAVTAMAGCMIVLVGTLFAVSPVLRRS